MDDLDHIKQNAGITETPITDLPPEANEQLAVDMEKIAAEAIRVAEDLRTKNKKAFASNWEEFSYLARRTMQQMNQKYR